MGGRGTRGKLEVQKKLQSVCHGGRFLAGGPWARVGWFCLGELLRVGTTRAPGEAMRQAAWGGKREASLPQAKDGCGPGSGRCGRIPRHLCKCAEVEGGMDLMGDSFRRPRIEGWNQAARVACFSAAFFNSLICNHSLLNSRYLCQIVFF